MTPEPLRDAEYVRRLEHLARVVGRNEDGVLDCWTPVPGTSADPNSEAPCLDCAVCRLREALDEVEAWMNEHDYWPPELIDGSNPPSASAGGSGRGGEEGFSQGSPDPAPACDQYDGADGA